MASTVLDVPAVADEIERSADPDATRGALERLLEAHPDVAGDLVARPTLREAVVAIAEASHSLLTALIVDPSSLELLHGRGALADERRPEELSAAALEALDAEEPLLELRRWKRREMVRIAARDLLGIADLRAVGRELSALAAAALRASLQLAAPAVPMAVIGMGKLGGRELNYSSDVDVMFVHDGPAKDAERAARAVLHTMSAPLAEGIVFRTDADLRPEGRSGALSRSLDAFEAYWERWAQTWERQALIKAWPVAGDPQLGAAFIARAEPHVWPDVLDPDAVREIRTMKARTEAMLRERGLHDREVKRGWGGIRDIEFAVQLLQLVHGRHDRSVRSPTTLEALEQLAAARYVSVRDARQLDEAYVWLRTVEHRIQLLDEQQRHTIPADPSARTHLARVLGFRDEASTTALDQFDASHRGHQTVVRAIHEKLFFAPLLDTLAGAGYLSLEAAEERLAAFGFHDLARTRDALRELTSGLTRRSRVMQQLLPVLLEWLSEAPDPDLGLLQLRRLIEGPTRSAMLARTFRESPVAAERACRVLGASRVLGAALHRQPDFFEMLGDDAALAAELSRDELVAEALDTLDWREDEDARRAGLRRFKRRHLLRIGARDVLGLAGVATTGRELAHVADATLESALAALEPQVPFAVIGMGRLGGAELSYASDIDVLFVYDGGTPGDFAEAERLATQLMRAIGAMTAEGQTFAIDANLRPEGKQGTLARSLDGYRNYYERWALVWEFQSLLRARFVAGDAGVADDFCTLIEPFVYRDPLPEESVREVRRIKARVERERIPAGDDPQFHLKLGRGSLSDVEFTVQLLQLRHGAAHPEVREPSTTLAIERLASAALLSPSDAEILADSYRLCERARNYRYLLTGTPGDSLPVDTDEAEHLARMLGYVQRPQTSLRDEYRRVTRRARAVVERVFYGRE